MTGGNSTCARPDSALLRADCKASVGQGELHSGVPLTSAPETVTAGRTATAVPLRPCVATVTLELTLAKLTMPKIDTFSAVDVTVATSGPSPPGRFICTTAEERP